jgi:putative transcriptional regulator
MIKVKLAVLLAQKEMKLKDLEEKTGIAMNNLSVLKTGKAKAIRFSTLEEICKALGCQPGDLLEYQPGDSPDDGEDEE